MKIVKNKMAKKQTNVIGIVFIVLAVIIFSKGGLDLQAIAGPVVSCSDCESPPCTLFSKPSSQFGETFCLTQETGTPCSESWDFIETCDVTEEDICDDFEYRCIDSDITVFECGVQKDVGSCSSGETCSDTILAKSSEQSLSYLRNNMCSGDDTEDGACTEFAYGCQSDVNIKLIECGVSKGNVATCDSGQDCIDSSIYITSTEQSASSLKNRFCSESEETVSTCAGFCNLNTCDRPFERAAEEIFGDCSSLSPSYICCKETEITECIYQSNIIPIGDSKCIGMDKVSCLSGAVLDIETGGCESTPTCLQPVSGTTVDVGFKFCRFNHPQTEVAYECLSNTQWKTTSCPALCNGNTGNCFPGDCVPGQFRNEVCSDDSTLSFDKCGTDRLWDNDLEKVCGTDKECKSGQCMTIGTTPEEETAEEDKVLTEEDCFPFFQAFEDDTNTCKTNTGMIALIIIGLVALKFLGKP